MSEREEVVVGTDGEPILYCVMREGCLEASFEIYGNKDQSDLEIIDTIYPSEFPKILELFGLPSEMEILDAIRHISVNGQGERFKKLIRDNTIKAEHFSWMTDRD